MCGKGRAQGTAPLRKPFQLSNRSDPARSPTCIQEKAAALRQRRERAEAERAEPADLSAVGLPYLMVWASFVQAILANGVSSGGVKAAIRIPLKEDVKISRPMALHDHVKMACVKRMRVGDNKDHHKHEFKLTDPAVEAAEVKTSEKVGWERKDGPASRSGLTRRRRCSTGRAVSEREWSLGGALGQCTVASSLCRWCIRANAFKS